LDMPRQLAGHVSLGRGDEEASLLGQIREKI
jgi:hypothetical protein